MNKLLSYRERWTVDTEVSRKLRFQTEVNNASGFLPDKFKVSTVRLLPGTPKVLELLRENLMEKYGILGISVARNHLGNGVQLCDDILRKIKNLGIKLSLAQSNQVCEIAAII